MTTAQRTFLSPILLERFCWSASAPRFPGSRVSLSGRWLPKFTDRIILSFSCSRRRASNRSDDQHCKLSRVKRPTARATIPRTQSAPNSRLRQAPPSRASTIGRKCHLYATCTSFIVLVPLPGFLHVNTQKNGRRVPGGRAAGWQAKAAGRRRLGGNGNMDRVSGT